MRLRERVFVGEQGIERVADRDGLDSSAIHVVAVEDGVVVGTCRLLAAGPTQRLGRLAVEPGRRREGIGLRVLEEADRVSRAHGSTRIVLNAQTYAEDLYAAAGYQRVGGLFMEEGIEHVRMEKRLA